MWALNALDAFVFSSEREDAVTFLVFPLKETKKLREEEEEEEEEADEAMRAVIVCVK